MKVVLVLPKKLLGLGLYTREERVTTLCKSWDICKPGSGAVGSLPGRAFEGSGNAELPGLAGGGPLAFISVPLCPLYLRLSRRPGGPLCLSLPAPPAAPPLQCPAGRGLLLSRRRRTTRGGRVTADSDPRGPAIRARAPGHPRRCAQSVPVRSSPFQALERRPRPGWPRAGRWLGSCCWRLRASEGRLRGPGSPSARMY